MELSSCFFLGGGNKIWIYFINVVSNLIFELFKMWSRSTVEV